MNIALILAGGSGKRTGQDVPKQFLNVDEKPIIIYTLEAFQSHSDIDAIIVTCIAGWENIIQSYAQDANITKLKWITHGGENVQESIHNAIHRLSSVCCDKDIIIIHDAVRPMISEEVISDCIQTCINFGSGLSAVRCQETIMRTDGGMYGNENIDRSEIMRVQTPQAYEFHKVHWALKEADKRGIKEEVYMNTLLLKLGEKLYFSLGSNKNIKITTTEDMDIFHALNQVRREKWVK